MQFTIPFAGGVLLLIGLAKGAGKGRGEPSPQKPVKSPRGEAEQQAKTLKAMDTKEAARTLQKRSAAKRARKAKPKDGTHSDLRPDEDRQDVDDETPREAPQGS